jgi:hypothetical protein
MRADEAVKIVRDSVFKPGWRMEAQVYYEDFIYFTFYIDTVDTSYPSPDGTCRKQVTLVRDELWDVGPLRTVEDVFAKVLKLAAEIDVHENREFLKHREPGDAWHAPLHPHTREGEYEWSKRQLAGSLR